MGGAAGYDPISVAKEEAEDAAPSSKTKGSIRIEEWLFRQMDILLSWNCCRMRLLAIYLVIFRPDTWSPSSWNGFFALPRGPGSLPLCRCAEIQFPVSITSKRSWPAVICILEVEVLRRRASERPNGRTQEFGRPIVGLSLMERSGRFRWWQFSRSSWWVTRWMGNWTLPNLIDLFLIRLSSSCILENA